MNYLNILTFKLIRKYAQGPNIYDNLDNRYIYTQLYL